MLCSTNNPLFIPLDTFHANIARSVYPTYIWSKATEYCSLSYICTYLIKHEGLICCRCGVTAASSMRQPATNNKTNQEQPITLFGSLGNTRCRHISLWLPCQHYSLVHPPDFAVSPPVWTEDASTKKSEAPTKLCSLRNLLHLSILTHLP